MAVALISLGHVTGSVLSAPHLLRFRGAGDDGSEDKILGSLKAKQMTGKLSKEEITEKLNRVPVFCIMKPDGSVISLPDKNGAEGDECCTWFLSAAEVQSVFGKVKFANPDEEDLHIVTFGLGSAFEMCGGWPDSTASEYDGKLLLQGDQEIVKHVDPQLIQAIKHQGLDPGAWRLPIFVGDALAQTEGSEEEGTLRQSALPVFFSPYDLKAAYEKVGVPLPEPGPKLMDLRQLVAYMAAEPEEFPNPWRAVEFITSTSAAELAKNLVEQ